MSYEPRPHGQIAAPIPSACGRFEYRQSSYDGTWWKHWKHVDHRPVLIGRNPPQKP
jgi:hypothetical protein